MIHVLFIWGCLFAIGSVVQSKDVSCVASRQTKPRVTRFGSDGSTSSKLLPRILLRVSKQFSSL